MYTGYNELAREILNLKTQKLQDDKQAAMLARMDALAKDAGTAQKGSGGGGGGSSESQTDRDLKQAQIDKLDEEENARWNAENNKLAGGGSGQIYGSSGARYNAEDTAAEENSDDGSSSGWDSGGSSSSDSSSSDDSGGYLDAGTTPSQDSSYAAKGGPVKAGKKYIVGEGGKDEVYVQGDGDVYPLTEQQGIIPKEDGTIIPNPKLRKLARVMLNNKG